MATTSVFDSTAPLEVGTTLEAELFWCQVAVNAGTLLARLDVRAVEEGTTSFNDIVGNTWTLSGTAEIVAYETETFITIVPSAQRTNIIDYDDDGAERPITGLVALGAGEGDSMVRTYVEDNPNGIPLWEDKLSYKSEDNLSNLSSLAQFELQAANNLIQRYTIEVDPNLPPFMEDIQAGNYVRVVIDDRYTQEDGLFWIGRKKVVLSKQHDESITLEVTE